MTADVFCRKQSRVRRTVFAPAPGRPAAVCNPIRASRPRGRLLAAGRRAVRQLNPSTPNPGGPGASNNAVQRYNQLNGVHFRRPLRTTPSAVLRSEGVRVAATRRRDRTPRGRDRAIVDRKSTTVPPKASVGSKEFTNELRFNSSGRKSSRLIN